MLLLTLAILVFVAFINSPGGGDHVRWMLYMDLSRVKGILGAYPTAVIDGVEAANAECLSGFARRCFASISGVPGIHTDYPPLGFLILGVFARLADLLGISDFLALKLSILLFTLSSVAVSAALSKSRADTGSCRDVLHAFSRRDSVLY